MSSLAIGAWLVGFALIIYGEFRIRQSLVVRFMIFFPVPAPVKVLLRCVSLAQVISFGSSDNCP
jgi:hypothetical protein